MVSWVKAPNFFNDKEWIAAGPNGKVVVTWTKFYQGPRGAGYMHRRSSVPSPTTAGRPGTARASRSRTRPARSTRLPCRCRTGRRRSTSPTRAPTLHRLRHRRHDLARSADDGRTSPRRPRPGVRRSRLLPDLRRAPDADRRALPAELLTRVQHRPVTGQLAIAWADDQGAGNCGTGGDTFSGTTSSQVKLVSGGWGFGPPGDRHPGADKVFPSVRRPARASP